MEILQQNQASPGRITRHIGRAIFISSALLGIGSGVFGLAELKNHSSLPVAEGALGGIVGAGGILIGAGVEIIGIRADQDSQSVDTTYTRV